AALIKAVDTYASMLRATVASAGNDHRLGANEAPPAIISIFLGEQLTDIIEQIEKGGAKSSKKGGFLEIGASSLPKLPKDVTDRNRTSPFAFTGNKFEFRAVGSNQSCSGANIVLNTIVAEVLDEICTELEAAVKAKKNFNKTLQSLLQDIIKKHKRILFNGDNYTDEWKKEAKKRGLPNLLTTPEAIAAIEHDADIAKMFVKHKVLSREEFKSRNEVYKEAYERTVHIEANCALTMAKTMIMPVAMEYQKHLAENINVVGAVCKSEDVKCTKEILNSLNSYISDGWNAIQRMEKAIENDRPCSDILAMMGELRTAVDALEGLLPDDMWPLPSYVEMLFMM
ncbi:MAG TPA: glutamine synthetase type III, partial [Candidatus Omnitrophota bacterium]|nr:glutamine synthetase type III [Candidatus Omnitrophota bacterium]